MRDYILILLISIGGGGILSLNGQGSVPLNDDCGHAITLDEVINKSYSGKYFLNINANKEPNSTPCIPSYQARTVWYKFTAITKYMRIVLEGNSGNNGYSLNNVVIGVFSGTCGALVEEICRSPVGTNIAELILPSVPGRRYYIAIGGKLASQGNFRLYINAFNTNPEPLQDCSSARVLCDKSPIDVKNITGFGATLDDLHLETNPSLDYKRCAISEDASTWYKWTCQQPGTLELTITPLKKNDDIDFLVWELPGGLDDCNGKQLIRNIISGENSGRPFKEWSRCVGPTGLIASDSDAGERCGCDKADNNFGAAINMEAGKSYVMLVMNYSQSGVGYHMEFGGTGTFMGPQPAFMVEPEIGLHCDQDFIVTDQTQEFGNELEYTWFFGEGAIPQTSNKKGPFSIHYTTWGYKYIVLTVKDPVNGCEVTTTKRIYAEPCCEDLPPLESRVQNIKETTCPWSSDGSFDLVTIHGGGPTFMYSIDGSPWVESKMFKNLKGGVYTIITTDRKGCMDTLMITIPSPDSVLVDAGKDTTIKLGQTVQLDGRIDEQGHNASTSWIPEEDILDCVTCLDPEVFPKNQTQYTLIVTDENGCTYKDVVTVFIDKDLPVYIPNVFSPNGDGINERFTLYSNRAMERVLEMKIFHRWGGLVYSASDFPPNDETQGWNGKTNGREALPGVYTYLIRALFIDGSEEVYAGDITLLR